MLIEYKKVRKDVKDPVRANPSDAGMDVFYCPPRSHSKGLRPGENLLLQTGLKFGIPHGYMIQVMNRSSIASKRSLVVGAHCVDSGYDGEVFVDMHNIGKGIEWIHPGEKIAQLVLVPVIPFRAVETEKELYNSQQITISSRGEGALGSTDNE